MNTVNINSNTKCPTVVIDGKIVSFTTTADVKDCKIVILAPESSSDFNKKIKELYTNSEVLVLCYPPTNGTICIEQHGNNITVVMFTNANVFNDRSEMGLLVGNAISEYAHHYIGAKGVSIYDPVCKRIAIIGRPFTLKNDLVKKLTVGESEKECFANDTEITKSVLNNVHVKLVNCVGSEYCDDSDATIIMIDGSRHSGVLSACKYLKEFRQVCPSGKIMIMCNKKDESRDCLRWMLSTTTLKKEMEQSPFVMVNVENDGGATLRQDVVDAFDFLSPGCGKKNGSDDALRRSIVSKLSLIHKY